MSFITPEVRMSIRRSTLPVIGAVALFVGLLPVSLTGGARTSSASVVVHGTPDVPDRVAGTYARRYGIDLGLANTIYRIAREHQLEPAAVFGLIATESGFDPQAVGETGSIGLMQIKPSTARFYDPSASRERLFRPETNLRVGMAHLSRELAHFRDNWTLGLLSYNMGRTRVSRALANGVIPRNGYANKVLAHCGKLCS